MNLTKRQRILSSVFLVGLVGLAVDRTVLRPQGGPRAASAGSLAPAPSGAKPAKEIPVAEDVPLGKSVTERLDSLLAGREIDLGGLRDPFALPALWSDTDAARGEEIAEVMSAFRQKHRLQAIVMQGEQACAQVDDTLLAPGQWLDGFQLISVGYRSAAFERDGKRAVLELVGK